MKTKLCFVILLSSVFFLFSCGEKHLIKNDAKRQAVEQAFAEKKAMFGEDNENFSMFSHEDLHNRRTGSFRVHFMLMHR